jgi:hypothetical protein
MASSFRVPLRLATAAVLAVAVEPQARAEERSLAESVHERSGPTPPVQGGIRVNVGAGAGVSVRRPSLP